MRTFHYTDIITDLAFDGVKLNPWAVMGNPKKPQVVEWEVFRDGKLRGLIGVDDPQNWTDKDKRTLPWYSVTVDGVFTGGFQGLDDSARHVAGLRPRSPQKTATGHCVLCGRRGVELVRVPRTRGYMRCRQCRKNILAAILDVRRARAERAAAQKGA